MMILTIIRRSITGCSCSITPLLISFMMMMLLIMTRFDSVLPFVHNTNDNPLPILSPSFCYRTVKIQSSELTMINKRRDFILDNIITASSILTSTRIIFSSPSTAQADVITAEDYTDLTTKMFNKDGSLKDDLEMEAKFRNVDFKWDASDIQSIAIDGKNTPSTQIGSSVSLQYKLPEKWVDLYIDKSEGMNQKVCERIVIYQAPGKATYDRLDKASRVGVYKSLQLSDDFILLNKADLIGGRIINKKDGQKYYEYDMALAPSTCNSESPENLGLGFCPYETIYLLSSTIVNERLYVFIEECKKDQWKRSNSELKTIRSSFIVEQIQLA